MNSFSIRVRIINLREIRVGGEFRRQQSLVYLEGSSSGAIFCATEKDPAPSQYPKRRLFVRSRKVSKPRDWYFKLSYRFEIWQAHRQHCCRSACQISERSDNSKYKSRGFETWRDPTERRLFGYWDGALERALLELVLSCWPRVVDKLTDRSMKILLPEIFWHFEANTIHWVKIIVFYFKSHWSCFWFGYNWKIDIQVMAWHRAGLNEWYGTKVTSFVPYAIWAGSLKTMFMPSMRDHLYNKTTRRGGRCIEVSLCFSKQNTG